MRGRGRQRGLSYLEPFKLGALDIEETEERAGDCQVGGVFSAERGPTIALVMARVRQNGETSLINSVIRNLCRRRLGRRVFGGGVVRTMKVDHLLFFFFTIVTGPRRSLSLKLSGPPAPTK